LIRTAGIFVDETLALTGLDSTDGLGQQAQMALQVCEYALAVGT
jgi:hypothetical protein